MNAPAPSHSAIFDHDSYRSYLRFLCSPDSTFEKRSFSLSALARLMGLPAPNLSQILREKRNLPTKSMLEIAFKMKMSEREAEYFMLLVLHEDSQNPDVRDFTRKRLNQVKEARTHLINPEGL